MEEQPLPLEALFLVRIQAGRRSLLDSLGVAALNS